MPLTTHLTRISFVLSVIFCGFFAHSAAHENKQSLYFLMQSSLINHPSLKGKQSELESAQLRLSAAQWFRYPTFGLNTRSFSQGTSVVATIEQPLWTGGKITGEISKAAGGKDVADFDFQETRLNLLLQVNEAFFTLRALQMRLVEAQNNVVEHESLLRIIERRVASEISPNADALFAQLRLRSAISQSIQIKRELRKATNALIQLTNQPITALSIPIVQSLQQYTLGQIIQQSLDISPNRQKLQSEVKVAKADIKLARSQALPNIILGLQSNLGVDETSSGRDGLYIGLQIESGAGLSALDNIKASSAAADALLQQVALFEIQYRQQIEDNWVEYQTLLAELEPLEFSYDTSIKVIESYIRQFRVGKKSWQDVMNAQKEKAENSYLLSNAQMQLLEITIRLKLQAGILHLNNLGQLQ